MMRVQEVMTTRVISIHEDATFSEVIKVLLEKNLSGVPVVDYSNKLVGILSEKDLLKGLFPSQEEFYKDIQYFTDQDIIEKEAGKLRTLKAKDLMTKEIISVSPEDNIMKAAALMLIHHIRRLPVVKDGELVGIVGTRNIFRNILKRFL